MTNDHRPPTTDQRPTTYNSGQNSDITHHAAAFSILNSQFSILILLGCGMALLYVLLQMRFPLAVLYGCPRTNLEKLTRIEATPPGLPLRFYDCPNYPLDNLTRPDIPTGIAMLSGTLLLFGGYALGALALRRPTTDRRPTANDQLRIE